MGRGYGYKRIGHKTIGQHLVDEAMRHQRRFRNLLGAAGFCMLSAWMLAIIAAVAHVMGKGTVASVFLVIAIVLFSLSSILFVMAASERGSVNRSKRGFDSIMPGLGNLLDKA